MFMDRKIFQTFFVKTSSQDAIPYSTRTMVKFAHLLGAIKTGPTINPGKYRSKKRVQR